MRHLKLVYLFFLFAIASCGKDDSNLIYDFAPAQVYIDIEDLDGNNLFSDEYHGILSRDNISTEISYTYKEETKPIFDGDYHELIHQSMSRYYMPFFYGLYVIYHTVNVNWEYPVISFGEFDGAIDQNECFTINWPDGTHNIIEFVYDKKGTRIRVDNGKWVKTKKIILIK